MKKAIEDKHNAGEAILDISGQINDGKFTELITASSKSLKGKYPNIDFNNLASVKNQYEKQSISEIGEDLLV